MVVANLVQISANRSLNAISSDDVVLGVLPFFHIYGMVIVLNFALRCGAHVVTMPGFDPPLFLRLLKAHGVSAARPVERAVCLPALPSHGPRLGTSAPPRPSGRELSEPLGTALPLPPPSAAARKLAGASVARLGPPER